LPFYFDFNIANIYINKYLNVKNNFRRELFIFTIKIYRSLFVSTDYTGKYTLKII